MADNPASVPLAQLGTLMQNLRIDECRLGRPDKFLTQPAIEKAFENFMEDMGELEDACRTSPAKMKSSLQSVFRNLVDEARAPYSVAAMEAENMAEKISWLENSSMEKNAEIARLVDSCARLVDSCEEKNAEIARLVDLYEEKNAEISRLVDSCAEKNAEIARLVDLYAEKNVEISRLLNSCDTLGVRLAAKEEEVATLRYEKDNLTQEKHDLMILATGSRRGSDTISPTVTLTQLWNEVLADKGTKEFQILPAIRPADSISETEFSDLVEGTYKDEIPMYDPIHSCVGQFINKDRTPDHPGSKLWLTNYKRKLNSLSPDFTITVGHVATPDSSSVIALWEVKHGELSKADHGQLYNYLRLLGINQPHRRDFVGVLSNLNENIVIHYGSPQGNDGEQGYKAKTCLIYTSVNIAHVVSYLREMIIPDSLHHPATTAFSIELREMKCRLGHPALNVVAAFLLPRDLKSPRFGVHKWVNPEALKGDGTTEMVVKRTVPGSYNRDERRVDNEIEMLLYINSERGHVNLPTIVYHTLDLHEFGITPRGAPSIPGHKNIPWPTVLENVLAALKWLHDHHVIHCDVRWDNVVIFGDRAVLVDLGASIRFDPDKPEYAIYDGGYICCPRELIGDFTKPYIPRTADDCYAFVQLVSMLLWPAFWVGIESRLVANKHATEAHKLRNFWNAMEASPYFKKYLDAAELSQYEILQKMTELCVYF